MDLKTGLQGHFVEPHTKQTKRETTNENMHDFFETASTILNMLRCQGILFCCVARIVSSFTTHRTVRVTTFRNPRLGARVATVAKAMHDISSQQASGKKERKEEKDKREKTAKKNGSQEDPNDL